ncbi:MAG: type II toxin-antitoxin system death-on-curing family toxin [Desulfovibrionaceae bacterium]|nr:type II toxin-antitoxin system death-on-curing family toxin [Desulfovibrionaceae bacterium]MBF0513866.1 type II toxin-antitoxin system death-on-curing family toxin [Desulfovibrionaceae bacterium]
MSFAWLGLEVILAIHEAQIAEHGGALGIRDAGLVESALAAPRALAAYGNHDLCYLAAAYGHALIHNHGFIDGNKRTAYVATLLFLELGGARLAAPLAERVLVFERLGAGDMTREDFAAWLRRWKEPSRLSG